MSNVEVVQSVHRFAPMCGLIVRLFGAVLISRTDALRSTSTWWWFATNSFDQLYAPNKYINYQVSNGKHWTRDTHKWRHCRTIQFGEQLCQFLTEKCQKKRENSFWPCENKWTSSRQDRGASRESRDKKYFESIRNLSRLSFPCLFRSHFVVLCNFWRRRLNVKISIGVDWMPIEWIRMHLTSNK